ncbi:phosphopantetheine-binding protein [Nocardioides antri]|uniref:phosphopantetheine-binding protein n=1 Tax=Nocardioides antri TaxID=2607659 RepID=UPI00165F21FC|nr:phosphopantetheine-binding protein [Nocardioides antri]
MQSTIVTVIEQLLERSNKSDIQVSLDSPIHGDGLGLDSLETAELSAILEDEFGTDPFGAGLMPETVAEIADYYIEGDGSNASVPA